MVTLGSGPFPSHRRRLKLPITVGGLCPLQTPGRLSEIFQKLVHSVDSKICEDLIAKRWGSLQR